MVSGMPGPLLLGTVQAILGGNEVIFWWFEVEIRWVFGVFRWTLCGLLVFSGGN